MNNEYNNSTQDISSLILSFGSQSISCCLHKYNNQILRNAFFKDLDNKIIKDCIICFNEINKEDDIIILPCKHFYHKECISKWFETSKTCPICRNE